MTKKEFNFGAMVLAWVSIIVSSCVIVWAVYQTIIYNIEKLS